MKLKDKYQSKHINNCQICYSKNLESIIYLGNIPPVNQMIEIKKKFKGNTTFPLELCRCKDCEHVQINTIVHPEILFPFSYPYLSGTTNILKKNFYDLCEESLKLISIDKGYVLDIGSNDGTLLENFKKKKIPVLGVEPSKASLVAKKKNIVTINDYFNESTVNLIKKKYGNPKIITAANVFAHIENPNRLVKLIYKIMKNDSVFISESHYLGSLIKTLQYDTIYHEHLRYYHLKALKKLFERNNLEIFHIKKIPTHGGSIRVYASKKKIYPIRTSVKIIENQEKKMGLSNARIFKEFKNKIIRTKFELLKLLIEIKRKKKVIYGVGAPSRASTLINFIGIDENFVDCILEIKGSSKIGKYVPGTKIPVLDEEIIFKKKPDYLLLFSWHIKKELIEIFKKKKFNGKFIIPLPKPKIIEQ